MFDTEDSAHRLATRIKDYWKRKGHDIETTVRTQKYVTKSGENATHFVVRSNLINGLPA